MKFLRDLSIVFVIWLIDLDLQEKPMKDIKKVLGWIGVVVGVIIMASLLACNKKVETAPIMRNQIVMSTLVHNNLDFLYFAIADRGGLEAWFCMVGYHDVPTGNTLISTLSPVWVDSADGGHIIGRPRGCGLNTVGTVHFHPGVGYCELSSTDIRTSHNLALPVTAIVCREHQDSLPTFKILRREEYEARWRTLQVDTTWRPPVNFTAIYRYQRP